MRTKAEINADIETLTKAKEGLDEQIATLLEEAGEAGDVRELQGYEHLLALAKKCEEVKTVTLEVKVPVVAKLRGSADPDYIDEETCIGREDMVDSVWVEADAEETAYECEEVKAQYEQIEQEFQAYVSAFKEFYRNHHLNDDEKAELASALYEDAS